MKNTFILFLLVAFAFCGCRKQVSDYERPDFDSQPTLNAVLQEGQPVWAQVTFAQGLDSVRPSKRNSSARWTAPTARRSCRTR